MSASLADRRPLLGDALGREGIAHGKVILMGEHAVVYGCPALAVGLPDGVLLRLRTPERPTSREAARLVIPAWDLDVELHLSSAAALQGSGAAALQGDSATHPVARACEAVLSASEAVRPGCRDLLRGQEIRGESCLPARAGLGSSAALSIALARLLLGATHSVTEVVAVSLAGESVFHGEASGIDSEIAARGGVLRFVRGESPQALSFPGKLALAVLPTGIPRSTADQVTRVREDKARRPDLSAALLEAVSVATNRAQTALQSGDRTELGQLMDVAHGLLLAMRVSAPPLDILCAQARASGALGAKLTGAGGGGCVIALARDAEHLEKLVAALRPSCAGVFGVEIST